MVRDAHFLLGLEKAGVDFRQHEGVRPAPRAYQGRGSVPSAALFEDVVEARPTSAYLKIAAVSRQPGQNPGSAINRHNQQLFVCLAVKIRERGRGRHD